MPYTMHTFETNSSNVPAFLLKLWNIVEDPACDDIIAWSSSGTSFIIKDSTRVSKEILQCYFKHSNMASFIRQLNMYGFRKVTNTGKSGLTCESNEMEFQHNYFTKGCAKHLEFIERKIASTKGTKPVQSNDGDVSPDLSSLREKQENMDSMLVKMKQENELLWRELTNMRKKNKAQEHVIQKVIQFLVSMVQRSNPNIGLERLTPCMLPDSSSKEETSQVACAIDVLNNKPNFVTVSQDKPLSPLVIHEVIEVEQETEENSNSSSTKSQNTFENSTCSVANENHETESHLLNTSLNNPINRSVITKSLSILKPLQPSTSALPSDGCTVDEFILGIPLEYINASSSNTISIPKEESCNNVFTLSESVSDTDMSKNFNTPGKVICKSPKDKYDDSLLSTELQTPKIPTSNIDVCSSIAPHHQRIESTSGAKESEQIKKDIQQNDSSCNLALPDSPNVLKQSTLTKNSVSSQLINIEKELSWLQDQISTSSWNVDTDKLLGLFNTDNITSNETVNTDISAETSTIKIKIEPSNSVEVEEDIGNNQFLQCLRQDAKTATENFNEKAEPEKLLPIVTKKTDKTTVSSGVEYFLSSGSPPKQKSVHCSKTKKLQKVKRQKIK